MVSNNTVTHMENTGSLHDYSYNFGFANRNIPLTSIDLLSIDNNFLISPQYSWNLETRNIKKKLFNQKNVHKIPIDLNMKSNYIKIKNGEDVILQIDTRDSTAFFLIKLFTTNGIEITDHENFFKLYKYDVFAKNYILLDSKPFLFLRSSLVYVILIIINVY